jgi:hypothetical protein
MSHIEQNLLILYSALVVVLIIGTYLVKKYS